MQTLCKNTIFGVLTGADSEAFIFFTRDWDSHDPSKMAEHVTCMWKHPEIQQTLIRSDSFQLCERNLQHFVDRIWELTEENALPTNEDCVRIYWKTGGILISPLSFSVQLPAEGSTSTSTSSSTSTSTTTSTTTKDIDLWDMDGHRCYRRNWHNRFDNTEMVIFVVNLCGYNQVLWENDTANRLEDELDLFDNVVNCEMFENVRVVLVLNRKDTFREKIVALAEGSQEFFRDVLTELTDSKGGGLSLPFDLACLVRDYLQAPLLHPLSALFPGYSSGGDYELALDYIKRQFEFRDRRVATCIRNRAREQQKQQQRTETWARRPGVREHGVEEEGEYVQQHAYERTENKTTMENEKKENKTSTPKPIYPNTTENIDDNRKAFSDKRKFDKLALASDRDCDCVGKKHPLASFATCMLDTAELQGVFEEMLKMLTDD